MKRVFLAAFLAAVTNIPAYAEQSAAISPATPVVARVDADALFVSDDPKLHANKQVVYNILKVLLEANQWDRASEFIAKDYIQHNPNAANGRDAVVYFFTEILKTKPKPVADKLNWPVAEVMAEGDLVTVITPRKVKTEKGTYTTAWFDTWRIKDGKAMEHWDSSLMNENPDLSP
jgi:predicted SnoaL-like aldol condensation-catalyzing enzyme